MSPPGKVGPRYDVGTTVDETFLVTCFLHLPYLVTFRLSVSLSPGRPGVSGPVLPPSGSVVLSLIRTVLQRNSSVSGAPKGGFY